MMMMMMMMMMMHGAGGLGEVTPHGPGPREQRTQTGAHTSPPLHT